MNQADRDRERRRAAKRRRRTNRLARGGKVRRVLRTSELANKGQTKRWPWLAGRFLTVEAATERDNARAAERAYTLQRLGRLDAPAEERRAA